MNIVSFMQASSNIFRLDDLANTTSNDVAKLRCIKNKFVAIDALCYYDDKRLARKQQQSACSEKEEEL